MKCDEIQTLHGPYLDSELDARTTLEIQQHLAACAACARLFAEEQKLEACLRAGLNRGQRTAKLWERIERSVVAATPATNRPQPLPRRSQPLGWQAILAVLGGELQAGWRRARWAWSGLAAAWVVILALNFAAREPESSQVAGNWLPPVSEVRSAVKQKQLLMAELALSSESAPADKPKPAPPGPRSDRRKETLNA